jgi:hypothetical protein
MTPTLQKQKALIDGGFTEQEISDWQVEQRRALGDAGFSQAEIDTEFGEPPLDPKPAAKVIRENIEKAIAADTADGQPKPVKDFMEALDAGFQGSVTGLLTRGKTPDKALAEDAPMASRIAGSIGALAGDIPAMVGGALIGGGGGPITATAGAFALPAGMRKVITDAYEKGEATNWTEFWERASGAIIETAKGYITGAATGAVGKAAGMLPIASPTAKAAATVSGEVATMVTVGKALEGEVPTADDFIDAAIVVGGVKGAVKTAKKMREVYSKAGVKPDEFIADTERDVTIGQDFVAENLEVPRAYGVVTAEFESPERGLVPVEPKPQGKTVNDQIRDIADELNQPYPEESPEAARGKMLSKISVREGTDKEPMTFQKLYTDLIDDLNPIREAVKKAAKDGALPTSDDPYQLARLTRGTFGKANQFLEYGTFDFKTYENNGPSLRAILNGEVRDLPELTNAEPVDLDSRCARTSKRNAISNSCLVAWRIRMWMSTPQPWSSSIGRIMKASQKSSPRIRIG